MRLLSIPLLLLGVLITLSAAQSQQNSIALLQQKYMNFDYPAVINSGNLILRTAGNLTRNDSLEIYRLQGLSYYAMADITGALRCFISILHFDPEYKLQPRDNPPKVIDFFEEIRLTLPKTVSATEKNESGAGSDFNAVQVPPRSHSESSALRRALGYSIILPGMGHLQYSDKSKGWVLLSSGLAALGSTVYFTIDTNRKEDAYLSAVSKAEIDAKYKDYNQAYKIRNTSLILFGTVWLYTQLDLLYWSKPYDKKVTLTPGSDYSGLTYLTLRFCF
jgi:tetratricopeptide (TPR) repeat protein